MNVLGRLALSQIKRKRMRTVMAVLAIVLSSSLLTGVVNFAASGNRMLVDFLGKDYGMYGGAYTLLLFIPALILGMLIVAMSVIVISNVFRMSANEPISEFGTLKCVGATGKQIYKTIMYEGAFLCAAAVPAGIILGYLLSFSGIGVANSYMDELNVLTRAMMMSVRFDLSFVFSPAALLVSVVISVGTVFFSVMFPAKKAMKMSALQCLKDNTDGNRTAGCRRTKYRIDGRRGAAYQLARKNTASGDKKMKSAVTAFSLSIVLFVTMSGLKEIADGVMEYISIDYGYSVMADYTSNYDRRINPVTGRAEYGYVQTIDRELAGKITEELTAYGDTEVYGMGQDYFTYDVFLERDGITEEMREAWDYQSAGEKPENGEETGRSGTGASSLESFGQEEPEYELPVEIILIDEKHYGEICRQCGYMPFCSMVIEQKGI